jgi:plasmid stabilization system protein ParE
VTLPVVWLPGAHSELREAVAHYDSIRPELAERFVAEVEQTITRIADGPLHYALVDKEKRRAGVRKLPYGLFFLVEETRVVIIACFHGRRHPKHWQSR